MKTIGDIIHQYNFPLQIRDDNGNVVYWEDIGGCWIVKQYSEDGLKNIHTDSYGFTILNN